MTLPPIDETHSSELTSWVPGADGHSEFPIQNLPFGIFSREAGIRRPGVAIGNHILDARQITGLLPQSAAAALNESCLNALLELAANQRLALRRRLSTLLSDEHYSDKIRPALHLASDCTLHLPAMIGDYTDFYAGIHHATNVGTLFRPDNPLLPNYKYVPIGYHGRASSIRLSGTPVVRPSGQQKDANTAKPIYQPTKKLDYELELGVWIGQGNALGSTIPISSAARHIAGFCLLNDWSARDLQAWEYQPLGPFLAKNFHTTISPWVVTSEAMAPFRIAQPDRPKGDPRPLPYLWDDTDQQAGALALELQVFLQTEKMRVAGIEPLQLSRGPAANMYWTVAQMVTHHASNGCGLNAGDLLGTGTISAPTGDGLGSLLEITKGGAVPLILPSGETRTFLEDGDEILFTAQATAMGFVPIGFGECRSIVRRVA